ncbi:hypothetical protein NY151_10540 [Porphyromonas gingivalis]|uniref:Uncharacterized protein n=1 Tax=Porphyromonas gingivalis TaxID=837 RepID=A0AAE9XED6_PORGN|nr:hypothetical protein [Porphyromonas gingivalis]WCG04258.1 hypothetical protein NY151_10540 [Porphyromonas gingivalis]
MESEKFTHHDEKNLVPFSRKTQTAIGRFLARGWPEIGSPKRG